MKHRLHLLASIAGLWVLSFPLPVHAQLSTLKKVVDGSIAPKVEATETPEATRKRLELWKQEAQDNLARFDASGAAVALPPGVTQLEMEDLRRDFEQSILTATNMLKNINSAIEDRKALDRDRAEEAAWTGFNDPPPYSMLMADDLLNERDGVRSKLNSSQSSLANFERLHASTITEAKSAEDAVNAAIAALGKATPEMTDAAKWRLDAARTKSRLFAMRAGFIQSSCDSLRDRIESAKTNLTLVERKIKTVIPNAKFTPDDLAKLEKISDERTKAYQKEITIIAKRIKAAMTTRTQAQDALDALTATAKDNKAPDGLDLAKFRVEVAEDRMESLQSINDALESLIQLEDLNLNAYQDRSAVISSNSYEEKTKARAALNLFSARLGAWQDVLANEVSTCGADLSSIESHAASITADDPRFALLNEQRAACSENLATLQRVVQSVDKEKRIIDRWLGDFSPKDGSVGIAERVNDFGTKAKNIIKTIWSFEVMSYVDSVEVDGQTITGKVPVTLGELARAVIIFGIGYLIASRIARRIQHTIVTRGHIADAQATTLRNWVMIVVSTLLALGTLTFLGIPPTVFAFVGGALVIGVGFGTQTLIKNFISGIIVLMERKVRVGDILDVNGIIGTVTEVNTRSSIIRSGQDVETIIPNSMFLENSVTNWTLSSAKMRKEIRIGTAYGASPQTVMTILTESAGRHGLVCKDPAPFAVFEDFGDSALIFVLYFWVDLHGGASAQVITSDLRIMIEKRLMEAEIGIPYPQRNLHLVANQPLDVRIAHPQHNASHD